MLTAAAMDITLPAIASGVLSWMAGTAMRFVKQLATIVPQVNTISTTSLVHASTGSRNTIPCGTMASVSVAISPGSQRIVSLAAEQAGDECARHAGNTDQAVGDAVDSGVEAEHCTNRVREADAGIADKHKVERRREQQQSEHVRPVLDEESHACLEVFKWGGQLLVAAIRGTEADEAFERGCAGEACDGDDHHETDAEHRIQHAAEEARQQTA